MGQFSLGMCLWPPTTPSLYSKFSFLAFIIKPRYILVHFFSIFYSVIFNYFIVRCSILTDIAPFKYFQCKTGTSERHHQLFILRIISKTRKKETITNISKTKIDIRKRKSYHKSLHNFKIKNKENLRTQFSLVSATLLELSLFSLLLSILLLIFSTLFLEFRKLLI